MKIKLINEAFDKQYGVKASTDAEHIRAKASNRNFTLHEFYDDDFDDDEFTSALYNEAERRGLRDFYIESNGQAGYYIDQIMFDRNGKTMVYNIDSDVERDAVDELGYEGAAKKIISNVERHARDMDETDIDDQFEFEFIESLESTDGWSDDVYDIVDQFMVSAENLIQEIRTGKRNSRGFGKTAEDLAYNLRYMADQANDAADDLERHSDSLNEAPVRRKNENKIANIAGGGLVTGLAKKKIGGMFEDLGKDVDKYQEWIDYDMKRYGKISAKTNREIRKAGLRIVKDKYGDYEVIA